MLGTVYAAIHGLGWLAPAFTMAIEEPKPAKLQEDPELKCRREKIVRLLHVQLMDFQTNSPDRLDTCVTTMLQMFTNILQDPDNEKYRKIRANNPNFKKYVLDAAKQTEDFLLAAGWHTMVEKLEKHWVFDAALGSPAWKYLHIAQYELQSAQRTIQQKAARHAKQIKERLTEPQKEREKLLQQLEADKASRKDRFQPILSSPLDVGAATSVEAMTSPDTSESSTCQPAKSRLI